MRRVLRGSAGWGRWGCFGGAAFCLLAAAPGAVAETTQWRAAGGGFFTAAGNWDNGVPDGNDTAVFPGGPAAPYAVTFPGFRPTEGGVANYASRELRVRTGVVSFVGSNDGFRGPSTYAVQSPSLSHAGRGTVIGEAAGDAAVVNAGLLTFAGAAATLGSGAGASGTLNVQAGTFQLDAGGAAGGEELLVGRLGAGALNVTGGGRVRLTAPNSSAVLGLAGGSVGTVTVSGPGAAWEQTGVLTGLRIGDGGTGSVTVSAGARLTAYGVALGRDPDSRGSLTVDGAGSVATLESLGVAVFGGAGAVTVSDGGRLRSAQVNMSAYAASTAPNTARVSGAGSTWETTGIGVGGLGAAAVEVTAGGRVTTAYARVGSGPAGPSSVRVDGAGSEWANTGPLIVAESFYERFPQETYVPVVGSVHVTGGAHMTSAGTTIGDGRLARASGMVAVAGAGSRWVDTGPLVTVGASGGGTLSVLRGARVDAAAAHLGAGAAAATGLALVDGAGSRWDVAGELLVGELGVGTLHVTGGAAVTSGTAQIARRAGGHGTVTVSGPGSSWTVAGGVTLGGGAQAVAEVTVADGGTMTVGGDVTDAFGASALTLDGGTLDLAGHRLGRGSPIDRLGLRAGTLRSVGEINNGAGLTKTAAGTLTLDGTNRYTGATRVLGGTLAFATTYTTGAAVDVADGAVARIAPSAATPRAVVLRTGTIDTHATGRLDLADNKLIVAGGDVAALTALVRSGFDNGSWAGPGLRTSAATPSTVLGVARAEDVGRVGGTFGDATVAAGDVLVAYTLYGDATLDGRVDFDDLVKLAQNYNAAAGRYWAQGDFTYDGATDFNDLVKLAQNYNTALPAGAIPGAPANFAEDFAAAFATVPEPAAAAPLAAAACAVAGAGRRRRRQRVRGAQGRNGEQGG